MRTSHKINKHHSKLTIALIEISLLNRLQKQQEVLPRITSLFLQKKCDSCGLVCTLVQRNSIVFIAAAIKMKRIPVLVFYQYM